VTRSRFGSFSSGTRSRGKKHFGKKGTESEWGEKGETERRRKVGQILKVKAKRGRSALDGEFGYRGTTNLEGGLIKVRKKAVIPHSSISVGGRRGTHRFSKILKNLQNRGRGRGIGAT